MKVLLSVTGGIAAYKAIDLTSKLIQRGHEVKVLMTTSALKFVTPLSFQALSRNEVHTDLFDETNPEVIKHIALADWADINVVAPATAATIGKIAHGISDNMVTTTLLASTKPIVVAPAMNSNMYANAAVLDNIALLKKRGVHFIEPGEGFLACGYIAKGRMAEPLDIIDYIESLNVVKDLQNRRILITAGPTIERIDAVRYLTNHSSGKMGYALSKAAAQRGAEVTLVSGPTNLEPPQGVKMINVGSAEEMLEAVKTHMDQDIIIKTAAVADYTPKHTQEGKMKKQSGDLTLELKRTEDILMYLGAHKSQQYLVGFAAETDQVETYAKGKLEKKNADVIIANNVGDRSIGFQSNDNEVTMYFRSGAVKPLPKMPKEALAHEILTNIVSDAYVR